MKRIKDKDVVRYLDEKSEPKMELLYEDGSISQIRFYFSDDDPTIKNKRLYLDTKRFKKGYAQSYERHFMENGFEKVEVYEDDELTMYSLSGRTPEYRLTKLFTPEGELFEEERVYYNKKGIPYRIRQWTKTSKGNQIHDSKIPIFEGYEDASTMTEEDWRDHGDLVFAYLYSDDCEPFEEECSFPF